MLISYFIKGHNPRCIRGGMGLETHLSEDKLNLGVCNNLSLYTVYIHFRLNLLAKCTFLYKHQQDPCPSAPISNLECLCDARALTSSSMNTKSFDTATLDWSM